MQLCRSNMNIQEHNIYSEKCICIVIIYVRLGSCNLKYPETSVVFGRPFVVKQLFVSFCIKVFYWFCERAFPPWVNFLLQHVPDSIINFPLVIQHLQLRTVCLAMTARMQFDLINLRDFISRPIRLTFYSYHILVMYLATRQIFCPSRALNPCSAVLWHSSTPQVMGVFMDCGFKPPNVCFTVIKAQRCRKIRQS